MPIGTLNGKCKADARRSQENLEGLFASFWLLSLFILHLCAFNSFICCCVRCPSLSLWGAPCRPYSSPETLHTCVGFARGCYNPGPGARVGITATAALPSLVFKQGICPGVAVMWGGRAWLACCLMAMVHNTFGPSFSSVYPLLFGLIMHTEPVLPLFSQDGCF